MDVNSITLLHKTIRIVVGKNTFFPFHDLHSRPLTRSLTTRRNHRSLNGQREIPRRETVLGQIPASGMQCHVVHSIKAEIIGERSLQYIDYAGEFNIYQNLTFICVSNIFPSEPRLRIWRSWSHRTRPQAQVEHLLPHQYITQEWIGCPNTKQGGT